MSRIPSKTAERARAQKGMSSLKAARSTKEGESLPHDGTARHRLLRFTHLFILIAHALTSFTVDTVCLTFSPA